MTVIAGGGDPARTLPCPVPAAGRPRPRGARKTAAGPLPPSGPVTVQRRVPARGGIMAAARKVQAGLIHAGKIVTVTAGEHGFRLIAGGQAVRVVPRTTRETRRHKACAARPRPGGR